MSTVLTFSKIFLCSTVIGCFVYWAIGYAFAFGDGNLFIGYSGWFGTFTEDLRINWLFHFVFAATACTIVSGSVAERCDIWPYFIYSSLITGKTLRDDYDSVLILF